MCHVTGYMGVKAYRFFTPVSNMQVSKLQLRTCDKLIKTLRWHSQKGGIGVFVPPFTPKTDPVKTYIHRQLQKSVCDLKLLSFRWGRNVKCFHIPCLPAPVRRRVSHSVFVFSQYISAEGCFSFKGQVKSALKTILHVHMYVERVNGCCSSLLSMLATNRSLNPQRSYLLYYNIIYL